jgi:hypothetical protein
MIKYRNLHNGEGHTNTAENKKTLLLQGLYAPTCAERECMLHDPPYCAQQLLDAWCREAAAWTKAAAAAAALRRCCSAL